MSRTAAWCASRAIPDQPFTAGFACAKVNRDAELVHSPERLATPLRRIGAEGRGQVRADHLGRGARRDHLALEGDHRRVRARWRCSATAYSAHQGQMNRGLPNGLFHALGTSRLWAGTVCDSCCEAAWDATVGPDRRRRSGIRGRVRPGRSPGAPIWSPPTCISGPRSRRSASAASSSSSSIRAARDRRRSPTGTCRSASAPTPRWRSASCTSWCATGCATATTSRTHTLGFDRVEREVLPRFTPDRVAAITGLAAADIERLAAMYGGAKTPFIRLGWGMTPLRLWRPGAARRGAAARRHRRLWPLRRRRAAGDRGVVRAELQRGAQAVGPRRRRARSITLRLGEALLEAKDPPIRALFIAANNPAVTCPDTGEDASRPGARGPVHRGARSVHVGHRALCRHRAAGGDLSGDRGFLPRLRHLLHAIQPPRGGAAGRGVVEPASWRRRWPRAWA